MAYTKKTWQDGPGGGTPITAADLNRMEDGIDGAATTGSLASKVDKITTPTVLYGTDGTGAPASYPLSTAANANAVAQRGAGGTLLVGTPTASGHATTKGYVDAQITAAGVGAQNLYGLYSARPVATSVAPSTVYYASDTQEAYRSNGTVWQVVGSGGSELGYAELTSVFVPGTTVGTEYDVTGLNVTITVPERPILLMTGGIVGNFGNGDGVIRVKNIDTGAVEFEQHINTSASVSTFVEMFAQRRISGRTPGSTLRLKIIMVGKTIGGGQSWSINGNAAYPAWLRVVTS